MKKFVSVVLALTMVVSMFATASAAKVSDYIDTPESENFLEYQLPIYVRAKKSSDSAYKEATEGLKFAAEQLKTEGVLVDFDARLDMQQIREVFAGDFYRLVSVASDFLTGKVATDVTVTVEYDKGRVIDTAAGNLISAANDVYTQVGERTVTSVNDKRDKITIKFAEKLNNGNKITVSELVANDDKYFSDITFELNDAVKYSNDGIYNIKVTLDAKTTFEFDDIKVNIGYSNTEGSGNFVVSAATDHLLAIIPAVAATCTTNAWTEGVYCKSHQDKDCPVHGIKHNGYDCGVMGTYRAEEVPNTKLNHKTGNTFATELVAEVPATCVVDGVKGHYTCKLCKRDFKDETATQEATADFLKIDKSTKSHIYETIIPARTKTCTVDGLTATEQCKVCGHKTGGAVTLATGHNLVVDAAIPATCTTAGKTEGKHCTECDYKIDQVDIAALGHSFGEWEVTTEATESNPGEMTRQCSRDAGHVETKPIPQLPPSHVCEAVEELAKIVPATCDTPGSKQNYCECGLPFGDPIEISALGHDLAEKAAIPATCTDKGIRHHWECSRCGKLFSAASAKATDVIQSAETPVDPDGHGEVNLTDLLRIEPTCYTVGWTLGKKCIKCDTIIIRPTLLPKKHVLEKYNAKSATCTEPGVVEHWHCTACNKDFEDEKATVVMSESEYTIAPLGHIWGDVRITNQPSDTEEGVGEKVCARDANHIETVRIAKLAHIHNEAVYKLVEEATCERNGKRVKVYTCCDEPYPYVDEEIIDKNTAHNLKTVAYVAPTCAKEGMTAHRYCTICGRKFKTDSFEEITTEVKLGKLATHTYTTSTVGHETVKECSVCHKKVKAKDNTGGKVHGVNLPNKVRNEEAEKVLDEDREIAVSQGQDVVPEVDFTFDEIGLSETLENEISKGNETIEDKFVLDIGMKANNKVVDNLTSQNIISQNKSVLDELPEGEFLKFTINIPFNMQGKTDYRVYRMHNGTHTANDIITETANFYGEKIVGKTTTTIEIQVRKFSEYALVAYAETQPPIVYPDPNPPAPSTGGGGSSSVTIKLNANGGTLLNNVTVKRGTVATLPTPVRDGYVFAGWYTDSNFTTPFDTEMVINRSYTLYAKWVELGECEGTIEDNCPCLKFYDLDPTMWYHRGVDYVLNRGMMNGVATTQFAPDWDVTRAMLVTVLWRAEGKPAGADTTFTDLEDGLYYVDAVKWAAANGVVNGYSDTVFAPNDAITREQFAAIMYRYAKNKGYDVTAGENTNILSYSDYDAISEYAIEAMQYTLGSGLIKGRTETTLNPKDNTTRAEMATILYRFFTEGK